MKNLALNRYIDLENKAERNNYIKSTLIGFIILSFAYLFLPFITSAISKVSSVYLAAIILFIFAVAIATFAYKICQTTKIINSRVKLGKSVILTILVLLILVVIPIISSIPEKVAVWHSPIIKSLRVIMTAIYAGICEEFLFRGLIFNASLAYFSKSKYKFVWTILTTSLVFALFHFINMLHQPLTSTIGQVLSVFAIGMAWGYIRLLANGISIIILLHIWQDIGLGVLSTNLGTSHVGTQLGVALVEGAIILLCLVIFDKKYSEQYNVAN
ncbi:membrane protease YdiL (CAAX protease family) [Lactobacillus colini]|uniref:Membrane protease YdiL (CAAX protease family) n=1 Tax=Lactobacillus colini TaxID=1819254 RepID=A0ABS4MCH4_9LACO|nr:CPBP family intramembrane glutamic endopeptidase [Lactobacillus colini]MBP2057374.1 membrane protease YdiL (CAAX protease family) [Lactobacillus colini]